MYRYLKAPPTAAGQSERAALVPVICTILQFSAEEAREARTAVAGGIGLSGGGVVEQGVGFLSSLLWGGGQQPQPPYGAVASPGRRRSSLPLSGSASASSIPTTSVLVAAGGNEPPPPSGVEGGEAGAARAGGDEARVERESSVV